MEIVEVETDDGGFGTHILLLIDLVVADGAEVLVLEPGPLNTQVNHPLELLLRHDRHSLNDVRLVLAGHDVDAATEPIVEQLRDMLVLI